MTPSVTKALLETLEDAGYRIVASEFPHPPAGEPPARIVARDTRTGQRWVITRDDYSGE